MTLSKWKRRRTSREIERTRFDNRVRTVISSDDKSLLGREVLVERDFYLNKNQVSKWRYFIPLPKKHPVKKKTPYVSYTMRCGIESKELAMMLADIEAADMGYLVTNAFELLNDIE